MRNFFFYKYRINFYKLCGFWYFHTNNFLFCYTHFLLFICRFLYKRKLFSIKTKKKINILNYKAILRYVLRAKIFHFPNKLGVLSQILVQFLCNILCAIDIHSIWFLIHCWYILVKICLNNRITFFILFFYLIKYY